MTTIWDNQEESGTFEGGWTYDDINLAYDSATDPDSGEVVYYDGIGSTVSWSYQSKS